MSRISFARIDIWLTYNTINAIIVNQTIMEKNAFAERLRSARKMARLSMDELAHKIGKSKNAIHKYETGQMLPDSKVLYLLAKALGVSIDYFFRKSKIKLNIPEFRKQVKASRKQEDAILEQAKDYLERYAELESLLDESTTFKNPLHQHPAITIPQQAEKCANEVREVWSIGTDPINNLIDLLEEYQIKVMEADADDFLDGICIPYDHHFLIVINKNKNVLRKRFSIAHEMGHALLNIPETLEHKIKEKICHRFASAFLMPDENFRKEFGGTRRSFSQEELEALSLYYGVSVSALIRRAKDLGLISEERYIKFFKVWSKHGYRKKEPQEERAKEIYQETVNRYDQLVNRALAEGIITLNKAAYFKNMTPEELQKGVSII